LGSGLGWLSVEALILAMLRDTGSNEDVRLDEDVR
jgi:hypothetical protein